MVTIESSMKSYILFFKIEFSVRKKKKIYLVHYYNASYNIHYMFLFKNPLILILEVTLKILILLILSDLKSYYKLLNC